MPLTIHYIEKNREVHVSSSYANWRSSWTPCEHLIALGVAQTEEERDSNLELWGSDLNESNVYTRVWCKRCAQTRGYTW